MVIVTRSPVTTLLAVTSRLRPEKSFRSSFSSKKRNPGAFLARLDDPLRERLRGESWTIRLLTLLVCMAEATAAGMAMMGTSRLQPTARPTALRFALLAAILHLDQQWEHTLLGESSIEGFLGFLLCGVLFHFIRRACQLIGVE